MQQAYVWCTAIAALVFLIGAVRIRMLPMGSEYGTLVWLLAAFCVVGVFAVGMPPSSTFYFRVFFVIIPLTWILYFAAARDLYQKIFKEYPGIAFAGRSSLWTAAVLMIVSVGLTLVYSHGALRNNFLNAVLLAGRCVLFSIAFFLILLVSVMIRYPIAIPRNVAVHSIFFSALLFSESLLQVADQWTSYHSTLYFNAATSALDAVIVTGWILTLSDVGDTAIVRIRQHIRPETEMELLGQLDALNGILLRAARK